MNHALLCLCEGVCVSVCAYGCACLSMGAFVCVWVCVSVRLSHTLDKSQSCKHNTVLALALKYHGKVLQLFCKLTYISVVGKLERMTQYYPEVNPALIRFYVQNIY